jgi:phosphatidylglycerol lysyltransferase
MMEHALPSVSLKKPRRENPNVARARELVLEHGWNSTSFQIVNPGIERWFSRDGEAVVGYVRSKGVRVVAGAPVCERERLAEIVDKFEGSARKQGESVCYFAAESRLESLISDNEGYTKFLLGAQPAWHPAFWADIVAHHKSFRAQLNRARNKGVNVTEWPIEKARNNAELADCLGEWLNSKGLPPLHFMVEPDTLARLENRRVFVAARGDQVIGFVVLSPVAQRNGWLFEQFPHRPGSPNGTVELMIDTAMRRLADDGCDYATLGLSPLSRRANVTGVKQPLWLRLVLGWVRKHGQRFYNFDGLDAFKAKLRPERWEPVFAVSNEPKLSFKTLYAIAGAFSGNAPYHLLTGAVTKAVATELRWLKERYF